MVEEVLDEYEFISKYGEGLEVNLWMEQAVQVIKELKAEIQRLHDIRDECMSGGLSCSDNYYLDKSFT